MIFVAGTLTIDPSVVDAFLADVAAMRPKVLEEAGCYHYSLLAEDRAGGVINVLEQWEDDDALKVHFTMPWIIEFAQKYAPNMKGATVKIYDIDGGRDLPAM